MENKSWDQIGRDILQIIEKYYMRPRYIALPGASRWTRIRVWFKNLNR